MIKEPLPELRCVQCGNLLFAIISPNQEYIEINPCEQCMRNVVNKTLINIFD
jgi:phage FluMu protein Com